MASRSIAPQRAFMIGDTHFPFVNKQYLATVLEKIAKFKPNYVLQMGDLYDFYCFSSYPGPRFMLAADEIRLGREEAMKFWKDVKKAAPHATRIQVWGNHDERLMKRIHERMPEAKAMMDHLAFYRHWQFDGVELQVNGREEVKLDLGGDIGMVWFLHGYLSQRAAHAAYCMENVVVGHTHRAELTWLPKRQRNIFELNVGHIADYSSPAMQYSPQRYSRSVAGYGYIDEEGPHAVSLGPSLAP